MKPVPEAETMGPALEAGPIGAGRRARARRIAREAPAAGVAPQAAPHAAGIPAPTGRSLQGAPWPRVAQQGTPGPRVAWEGPPEAGRTHQGDAPAEDLQGT